MLIPQEVLTGSPLTCAPLLATHHVTRFHLVPALLRVLLENYPQPHLQSRLPDLKLWCAGGESLSKASPATSSLLERLPCSRLINGYGTALKSKPVSDTA